MNQCQQPISAHWLACIASAHVREERSTLLIPQIQRTQYLTRLAAPPDKVTRQHGKSFQLNVFKFEPSGRAKIINQAKSQTPNTKTCLQILFRDWQSFVSLPSNKGLVSNQCKSCKHYKLKICSGAPVSAKNSVTNCSGIISLFCTDEPVLWKVMIHFQRNKTVQRLHSSS